MDDQEKELIPWAQAVMEMKDLYEQECQTGEENVEESDVDRRMRELEATLSQEVTLHNILFNMTQLTCLLD